MSRDFCLFSSFNVIFLLFFTFAVPCAIVPLLSYNEKAVIDVILEYLSLPFSCNHFRILQFLFPDLFKSIQYCLHLT